MTSADLAQQLLEQAEGLETLSQQIFDSAVELRKLAQVVGSRPESPRPSRFDVPGGLLSGGVEP